MRRISIVFALSTLLLVSICSAQQTSPNKQTNLGRDISPIGIEGPVIGGDGTANYIPIWRTPNYLLSSVIYQASGGTIGIGTTSPATKLDVNGGISTNSNYQIVGSSVLSIGSAADQNLFLGVGAGANNVAGSGVNNTFSGYRAGYANTTGHANTFSGFYAGQANTTGIGNTFSGYWAGVSNTTGSNNTFSGVLAGFANSTGNYGTFTGDEAGAANDTGTANTFSGYQAGYSNTTGSYDVFSGYESGYNNTTGNSNAFYGNSAGFYNTTGYFNTFYGNGAGYANTTGQNNTFAGVNAGQYNTTGSNDVYIGTYGPGSGTESNAIRIGGNTGYGVQTAAYIAGIYNATSSSGIPVYVNSNGQLGTQTSSLRFKEQVRDMGDSTNALMKLRPVTFLYKPEYDKGERALQYGLIAEEVAKVYPELVANDQDGQPYTVRYQYITTMLLNEVQKQNHRAEAQANVIISQQQEIESLKQQLQVQNATVQERLSRLEALARVEIAAAK